MNAIDTIPSLDLNDFFNPDKKLEFVYSLGKAFNTVGFVAIKNHFLTDELANNLYNSFQKFYSLEEEIKHKYYVKELAGQRGYTPKQKETAKGFQIPDLKEFFHIGQYNIPDNFKKDYPNNIFPKEVPEIELYGLDAYYRLQQTALHLLKAIAIYLNLPEDYFDKVVTQGNSILRSIHYFPINEPENLPKDAVRAAAHEDINLITLLMGASADGLEILNKRNQWIPVTALPQQIIVNVGDMLARLTNDKLVSTTHRVVNPSFEKMKLPRYSMPFFVHPRSDMDLTCLEDCISEEFPKKYDDITAGDFLTQRLIELKLK